MKKTGVKTSRETVPLRDLCDSSYSAMISLLFPLYYIVIIIFLQHIVHNSKIMAQKFVILGSYCYIHKGCQMQVHKEKSVIFITI
jgi:hypothetical protein